MSIEAGVLIDFSGHALYWHTPADRSVVSLPDDRNLWDEIWTRRDYLWGFAHSHPGSGLPGPSYTDLTTFAAVEAGLGVRLCWWIVSADKIVICSWDGPEKLGYLVSEFSPKFEPEWVGELRRLSGFNNVLSVSVEDGATVEVARKPVRKPVYAEGLEPEEGSLMEDIRDEMPELDSLCNVCCVKLVGLPVVAVKHGRRPDGGRCEKDVDE